MSIHHHLGNEQGNVHRHLEVNTHPATAHLLDPVWQKIAFENPGYTGMEDEMLANVIRQLPFGHSLASNADGEWVARNIATGEDIDLMPLHCADEQDPSRMPACHRAF